MKLKLARAAAVITLAAAATFAAPLAANASTYPPSGAAQVSSSTVAPGGAFSFSVIGGVFVPGESVTVTISGENASAASVGAVLAVQQVKSLGSWPANASGGLDPVSITLPSNASGTYLISATSPSVPAGVSASVTVSAAGGGSALPQTGFDSNSLLGLWVGGGALVLAGGAVAVAAAVHRQRRNADA